MLIPVKFTRLMHNRKWKVRPGVFTEEGSMICHS